MEITSYYLQENKQIYLCNNLLQFIDLNLVFLTSNLMNNINSCGDYSLEWMRRVILRFLGNKNITNIFINAFKLKNEN